MPLILESRRLLYAIGSIRMLLKVSSGIFVMNYERNSRPQVGQLLVR